MIMLLPAIGEAGVPPRVRLVLALAISLALVADRCTPLSPARAAIDVRARRC